jgi:hypothetical protein
LSTKTGSYSGSGKNPLSESSLNENGDKGDKSPSYADYAGGKTGSRIDSSLKYSGGNSGYGG